MSQVGTCGDCGADIQPATRDRLPHCPTCQVAPDAPGLEHESTRARSTLLEWFERTDLGAYPTGALAAAYSALVDYDG